MSQAVLSKTRLNHLSLKSPAKLNLYLKILNKRKDGFHNLETLFEKIDLCDRLTLRDNPLGRISIFSTSADCPSGSSNLAYQAAALLKKAAGVKSGVDITIEKNIPVKSGLGGGSSNAAAVLRGLNRLWRLGLSQKELLGLAKKIGSDVSFFIYDDSFALGKGRGERIVPIKGVKPFWHIIIVPKIKISTVEAYRRFDQGRIFAPDNKILTHSATPNFSGSLFPRSARDRSRDTERSERVVSTLSPFDFAKGSVLSAIEGLRIPRMEREFIEDPDVSSGPWGYTNVLTKTGCDVNIFIRALREHNLVLTSKCLFNDFSRDLLYRHPGLLETKKTLEELTGREASVSGKGPTIFSLVYSAKEAGYLKIKLARSRRKVFVVKTF